MKFTVALHSDLAFAIFVKEAKIDEVGVTRAHDELRAVWMRSCTRG